MNRLMTLLEWPAWRIKCSRPGWDGMGIVQQWEGDDCVKLILETEVQGQRSRRRQKGRWIDMAKRNLEELQLNWAHVGERRGSRWMEKNPRGWTLTWGIPAVHSLKEKEMITPLIKFNVKFATPGTATAQRFPTF